MIRAERRAGMRGVTMIEVIVAAFILVMVATMIWTAFDQSAHMRDKLHVRQEHDHLARVTLARMTRDLRGAFLSLHANQSPSLVAVSTQFVGTSFGGSSRLDMTTFTHRRLRRDSHEGDACEVGYRVEAHRGENGSPSEGQDLLRRESARIDTDPLRGGVVDVLMPGIRSLDIRYYDDQAQRWIDTWDTSQATAQPARLPPRVRITLTLTEDPGNQERVYSTETALLLTRPLTFGLPIY